MTTLHLNLPDEIRARLEARANEAGFPSIEGFAESILRAEADEQFVDEETERLLLERLNDPQPGIECTTEFREGFLEQIQQRRRTRGQRP